MLEKHEEEDESLKATLSHLPIKVLHCRMISMQKNPSYNCIGILLSRKTMVLCRRVYQLELKIIINK